MKENTSKHEDGEVQFIQSEGLKEIMKNSEDNLRDLWETMNRTSRRTIGVPEGEEREEKKKGSKRLFQDIIAENFPNLGQETEI